MLVSRKTTRDRCMKTASKDPEKRRGALQRKNQHDKAIGQTIDLCDFTSLDVHAQLGVRYVSVCS